jgi:ubiquinone biosynthesis protein
VLARFGPKLPLIVERALIAQAEAPKQSTDGRNWWPIWGAIASVATLGLGIWIGTVL